MEGKKRKRTKEHGHGGDRDSSMVAEENVLAEVVNSIASPAGMKKRRKSKEVPSHRENDYSELEASPVKKQNGRKSRQVEVLKVEGDATPSSSEAEDVKHQVGSDGQNHSELEASPVKKKKGRKSRRDEVLKGGGDVTHSTSDGEEAKHLVEVHDNSDQEVSPIKKDKKTVRFELPESEEEEGPTSDGDEDEEDSSTALNEDLLSDGITSFFEERSWAKDLKRLDLKYGKFNKDEDEILKTAVHDYIRVKKWKEDEGLDMLLHCKHHNEARGAWIEIAKSLPHRPVKQINSRAHRLLGGLKRGAWSIEDLKMLKQAQSQHGHDWKSIEKIMGRPAQLCKDKWRVLRLAHLMKKGKWTNEELDQLCSYVRWSLRIKEQYGKKAVDHREIRDDINWEVIGEKMCRIPATCAVVWYERLASPLVSEGCWANRDDHRLLQRLMETGASSEEAIDWDELLDDRDGRTCEIRWYQMIRLLGSDRYSPFEDKLELLVKRYAPDLLGIDDDFGVGKLVGDDSLQMSEEGS